MNVKQFAEAKEMNYPLVVDGPAEEIRNAYKSVGVTGFPSYLLIGPDGRILINDQVYEPKKRGSFGLHESKVEAIWQTMQTAK